jgi:hypothetical protein
MPSDSRAFAEMQLRKEFAFEAKCSDQARIASEVVGKSALSNGAARVVEKWAISGCGKEQLWEVTFNPDMDSDVSFIGWARRKQQ